MPFSRVDVSQILHCTIEKVACVDDTIICAPQHWLQTCTRCEFLPPINVSFSSEFFVLKEMVFNQQILPPSLYSNYLTTCIHRSFYCTVHAYIVIHFCEYDYLKKIKFGVGRICVGCLLFV